MGQDGTVQEMGQDGMGTKGNQTVLLSFLRTTFCFLLATSYVATNTATATATACAFVFLWTDGSIGLFVNGDNDSEWNPYEPKVK